MDEYPHPRSVSYLGAVINDGALVLEVAHAALTSER
jgi:hypothetical protein